MGRLSITTIVVLLAPWGGLAGFGSFLGPLMLWYLLGWSLMAVLVLRQVWRKERPLQADRESDRAKLKGSRQIPKLVILGCAGLALTGAVGFFWMQLDSTGRYYLVALAGAAGTGLLIASWNEL